MLGKSSVYNGGAEGMHFLTNVVHRISTFWTFHYLYEVVQIPRVTFETGSQFLYKLITTLVLQH